MPTPTSAAHNNGEQRPPANGGKFGAGLKKTAAAKLSGAAGAVQGVTHAVGDLAESSLQDAMGDLAEVAQDAFGAVQSAVDVRLDQRLLLERLVLEARFEGACLVFPV